MALVIGLPESAVVEESGVFPSQHYPSWFSMLVYHLGDEQYANWWQQLIDIVLPHRHNHHHNQVMKELFVV
jgi:hypothetical protein